MDKTLNTYFNGIEDKNVTGTFDWGTVPPNNWRWNQYIDEYKPNIYGSVKVKNVTFFNTPLIGGLSKVTEEINIVKDQIKFNLKNNGGNGIISDGIAGGGGGGGGSSSSSSTTTTTTATTTRASCFMWEYGSAFMQNVTKHDGQNYGPV